MAMATYYIPISHKALVARMTSRETAKTNAVEHLRSIESLLKLQPQFAPFVASLVFRVNVTAVCNPLDIPNGKAGTRQQQHS